MVKDICRVYEQNPNYLRHQLGQRILKGNEIFYDNNVIAVTGRQAQREEIVAAGEPCCIISSSGMLTGGPSQWYAGRLAADEGNFIALTGYQDEESPGHQLLALADGEVEERVLRLGEITLPVHCGIGKYGLSAHADKTEILSLVQALAPRNAFFVHGNPEVTVQLARDIQKELRGQVFVPQNGEEFAPQIRVPRKQLLRDDLPTLSHTSIFTAEDIPELWAFVMDTLQTKRGFTLEELGYVWSGRREFDQDELGQISGQINHSPYFEAEVRRPFIFHARSTEDIKRTRRRPRWRSTACWPWWISIFLRPPEKKIHRPIRIGQSVNQHEVLNIGKRMLEEHGIILKKNLAFMPKEMQVIAWVSEQPASHALIQTEFFRLTGLQLGFQIR